MIPMEEKVRQALADIQAAQSLIGSACAELCPVPGFADEWSGLCELYDVVKEHWYKVERRRQALQSLQRGKEAGQ